MLGLKTEKILFYTLFKCFNKEIFYINCAVTARKTIVRPVQVHYSTVGPEPSM